MVSKLEQKKQAVREMDLGVGKNEQSLTQAELIALAQTFDPKLGLAYQRIASLSQGDKKVEAELSAKRQHLSEDGPAQPSSPSMKNK